MQGPAGRLRPPQPPRPHKESAEAIEAGAVPNHCQGLHPTRIRRSREQDQDSPSRRDEALSRALAGSCAGCSQVSWHCLTPVGTNVCDPKSLDTHTCSIGGLVMHGRKRKEKKEKETIAQRCKIASDLLRKISACIDRALVFRVGRAPGASGICRRCLVGHDLASVAVALARRISWHPSPLPGGS